MGSAGRATAEVDYGGIVARHLETRLSAFGEQKVDRVLALAGLLRRGALVSNLDGSALDAGSFEWEGTPIGVTASFGVAGFPPGAPEPPEDLLRRADLALYQAKQEGRNRVGTAAPPP